MEFDEETFEDVTALSDVDLIHITEVDIDQILLLNWNPYPWIEELQNRLTRIEKKQERLGEHISESQETQIIETLIEIIFCDEIRDSKRLDIAMQIDPTMTIPRNKAARSTANNLFNTRPSPYPDLVEWGKHMQTDRQFYSVYATALVLEKQEKFLELANVLINEINERLDGTEIILMMNILCNKIPFFAGEWGRQGMDPFDNDNVETILEIRCLLEEIEHRYNLEDELAIGGRN